LSDFDQITPQDEPGLPPPVRWRVLASWASLGAERLWPVLWPAGGVVGLFLIFALANVFAYLPEWLHLISLLAFAGGIAGAAIWSLRSTQVPTRSQAVRHLEQSSGLEHRPLSTLEDKPATGTDGDTERLWHAHRHWVLNHLSRLKVAWPKLTLAARDPHALRVLIVLVIVALSVANWSEVPARLAAALAPGWAQGNAPATFEAWVTPPAYTGEAPRHLSAVTASLGPEDAINVPRGSTLTVRTHGDASAILRVGALGSSSPPQLRPEFLAAGGDARDAKLQIDTDMTVRLSLNASQTGLWRFKVVADTAPKIAFKTSMIVTPAQTMRFDYKVSDDFGVTWAEARIEVRHASSPQNRQPPKPFAFDLPLPPAPARQGDATIFKDMTAHVWAGLPAVVTLYARDELGQEARSMPMRIVLPERQFKEPLARALIEQRRSLARDPSTAPLVAKALDALSIAPEQFIPDRRNYLGLRTAYFMAYRFRVTSGEAPREIEDLQQLLWDLALRVEDGDTPQAQAELRAVQQKLMEALARGAPDEEIERLMAQLRGALERAVKAMAEKAKGQSSGGVQGRGQAVSAQDLRAMLEQIQDLARQGSHAAAQQMLSQLQDMVERMRPAGSGQMSPEQKATADALEQLGAMMARQRSLMDKTFREQQESALSGRNGKPSSLKTDQAKLRDELTPVIKKAGPNDQIASALKRAQKAMDQAAQDLGNGQLGSAGEAQQQAIDEMRKGGEAAAKQLLEQMAGATISGPGGTSGGEDEDPFGRPQSSFGPSFGNNVKVPDKFNIQKAREILEELQRRAAERGRPATELEYIERLLRRF
jgi:uncharacterized protein (TIGR02302 family)